MKYLSMIELLRAYNAYVKENHVLAFMDNGTIMKSITTMDDFKPFDIVRNEVPDEEPASEDEADGHITEEGQLFERGQSYNSLTARYEIAGLDVKEFNIHPILEVEWLKTELELEDEAAEILDQISYMLMIMTMERLCYGGFTRWAGYMERNGIIVEVEDLADTAKILTKTQLVYVQLPKTRAWTNFIAPAYDFSSMYYKCEDQSNTTKMIYCHLPMLLALFMMDYCANGLSTWDKTKRLDMENKLLLEINSLQNFRPHEAEKCTYALSSAVTVKDKELLLSMLSIIYDKLHKLNREIGLITFYAYKNVKSEDTTKASVRLCNMDISWPEEMERVRQEKEKAEVDKLLDQIDSEDDDDIEDDDIEDIEDDEDPNFG